MQLQVLGCTFVLHPYFCAFQILQFAVCADPHRLKQNIIPPIQLRKSLESCFCVWVHFSKASPNPPPPSIYRCSIHTGVFQDTPITPPPSIYKCPIHNSVFQTALTNVFGVLCRYPMYIESKAWVTNLKQKLACGSILISNKMEYFEFFTRALKPGIHYVEVDQNNICLDTAEKVCCTTLEYAPAWLICICYQFSSSSGYNNRQLGVSRCQAILIYLSRPLAILLIWIGKVMDVSSGLRENSTALLSDPVSQKTVQLGSS